MDFGNKGRLGKLYTFLISPLDFGRMTFQGKKVFYYSKGKGEFWVYKVKI